MDDKTDTEDKLTKKGKGKGKGKGKSKKDAMVKRFVFMRMVLRSRRNRNVREKLVIFEV